MARIYLGNVKGPKGDTGATGATGPQGEAATIEVGAVSTTEYGNAAQVTNVGSASAAKFDFVIPQGKPGEKTTKMGALTLDTITSSADEFPSPAVGDTGATAFGKIVKFFSDALASLNSKISTSKIANDFVTTDPSYVAAAPTVKALNDSLTNFTSGTLASYSYGQIQYVHLTDLKIAFIRWAGNANAPSSDITVSVPSNLLPHGGIRPFALLYHGEYMELNGNGTLSINYSGSYKTWSAGCLTYITV